MSAGGPAKADTPRWDYLLAHHFPDRYRRTFSLQAGSHRYHLCARCTGQVLGIVAYVAFVLWVVPHVAGFYTPQVQFLFAFAPLPGAIDWVTQAIGRRESTNSLRVATGFLAGATMADGITLILLQQWVVVAAALLVLAGYIGGLLIAIRRSAAWQRIIEEHFPGLELETSR